MPRTPLAWLNLTHDRVRFGLFVLGVVFAVVLMFVQLGFRGALLDSQTLVHERMNADLVLVSPNRAALAMRDTFPRRRLAQAAAVPGVAAALPLFVDNGAATLRHTDADPAARAPGRNIRVIGVDPAAFMLTLPELDPRHPDSPANHLRRPDTALYDSRASADFGGFRPGVGTELARRRITLAGPFTLGKDFTSEGTLIVSADTFADILRRPFTLGAPLADVDYGLVRLAAGADRDAVQRRLREVLTVGQADDPDVDVLTVPEVIGREQAFWLTNTPIGFAFGFGMVMGFAVGLVICYQILSGDVADHLPEYATLKAVGYPNRHLAWVVLQEALILAAAGYAAGLVVSWGLYLALSQATGMPLRMSVERGLVVLAATVVMCVASGLIALGRLVRADPADVFA